MNPIVKEAWACGNPGCFKLRPYTEDGKIRAERCCLCSRCKTRTYVEHFGFDQYLCKKCRLEDWIPELERQIEDSKQKLESAKKEMERFLIPAEIKIEKQKKFDKMRKMKK